MVADVATVVPVVPELDPAALEAEELCPAALEAVELCEAEPEAGELYPAGPEADDESQPYPACGAGAAAAMPLSRADVRAILANILGGETR